jgi:hypothetical protein
MLIKKLILIGSKSGLNNKIKIKMKTKSMINLNSNLIKFNIV